MIKRLTIWQVKSGLPAEEALQHWQGAHIPLVLALPGLRRYVQNRCVSTPEGVQPPFAGLGEVWFDDLEAAQAAMQSPEWSQVLDDALTFMDMDRIEVAWAEEQTAS
jgi:uncharacterized protein (TIGR02118 family)